jgi:hypothetical protein
VALALTATPSEAGKIGINVCPTGTWTAPAPAPAKFYPLDPC